MIQSVEIQNFKNIRHQTIDLERLTVFVGPNGCGKTSVLQAILRALEGLSRSDIWWKNRKGPWQQSLDWLLRRGASEGIVISLRTSEQQVTIAYRTIEPKSSDVTKNRVWQPEFQLSRLYSKSWLASVKAIALRLSSVSLSSPSYSESSQPQMGADGTNLPSVLAYMALNDPDGFENLVDELRTLIPQVRRLRFTKMPVNREETEIVRFGNESIERRSTREYQGDAILFDYDNAKGVLAQTVSEGTMLLLGLLTVLLGPEAPDVLLLDDIEHGLHPLAQKTLLETLTKIMDRFPDLQILATAHSPYLLDGLKPEQVRLMTIGADGYSVCGRLVDHPDFDKWKDEMAPGELWSLFGEKWLAEAGVAP